MFYQTQHSLNCDHFKVEHSGNCSFPTHLHTSFEFIVILSGEMSVTVDNTPYLLKEGEALLIFPNQLHALKTNTHSTHLLCIFSPHLVKAYGNVFFNKSPKSNFFVPNRFYIDQLFRLKEEEDPLLIKGVLYSLCAQFNSTAEYIDSKIREDDLLLKIFAFVQSNYMRDCSLRTLAEHISYHEVYLSRYFRKCTGLTFSEYVNRCRVNEGAYILKNSQKKILDIAYDCGFESLRSFNRNFKAIMGITPHGYRNGMG